MPDVENVKTSILLAGPEVGATFGQGPSSKKNKRHSLDECVMWMDFALGDLII